MFVVLLAACGGGSDSSVGTGTDPAPPVPAAGLRSLQTVYVKTIRAVGSSVVQVETPAGLGSGIVLDNKGNIVTNDHVVGSFKRFQVTDSSGRRYSATLVGTFPPDDLAVVHVSSGKLATSRPG
jgi:S1-C subfamily serine protease